MELRSFTDRIIGHLDSIIRKKEIRRLVWLGVSPGIPIVDRLLDISTINDVRVVDNDAIKQGWEIRVDGKLTDQKCIIVEKFDDISDEPYTLYICANTHYKDFVAQLSGYGVAESRIVDLNRLQLDWMTAEMEAETSGYHRVTGRELQLEELKILKWFRDYCSDNKLRWYLGEGTLLGAVRHKGFIPWDDDIDTFMPYEDYLRLITIMPNADGYKLVDWRKDDKYPFQFAKIIRDDSTQFHPTPFGYLTLGCNIDIFPLAGYPADDKEIKRKYGRNKELDFKWDRTLIESHYDGKFAMDIRKKITDEKYRIAFYEAINIGTMQQIAGDAWAIERKNFDRSIPVTFEDNDFPAPEGYESFLKARYGNYMEMPPVEKRRIHSFPTFIL